MIDDTLLNRYIKVQMILDSGQFPGSGTSNSSNIKIIEADSSFESITVEAIITKASGLQACSADINIYGLLNSDIEAFTRYNQTNLGTYLENSVQIYAGYKDENLSSNIPLVYDGQIRMAGPDRNNKSRPFRISSLMGIVNQNDPIAPTNLHGTISISDLFKSIISKQDNLVYKPFNVTGIAINPNYSGSVIEQLREATEHFGYRFQQDGPFILVAPINQSYSDNVIDINVNNGLLGYLIPDEFGINIRIRFNPIIQFGQQINLTTAVDNKHFGGLWFINGLQHFLNNKGRQWESVLKLNRFPFNISE